MYLPDSWTDGMVDLFHFFREYRVRTMPSVFGVGFVMLTQKPRASLRSDTLGRVEVILSGYFGKLHLKYSRTKP